MSYSDVWTNANDDNFQGRCMAALWDVCQRVANEESGFPASGQEGVGAEDIRWALIVLRGEQRLTQQQLAQQVLRNATIAASPATASDNEIQYTINAERWAELREIS